VLDGHLQVALFLEPGDGAGEKGRERLRDVPEQELPEQLVVAPAIRGSGGLQEQPAPLDLLQQAGQLGQEIRTILQESGGQGSVEPQRDRGAEQEGAQRLGEGSDQRAGQLLKKPIPGLRPPLRERAVGVRLGEQGDGHGPAPGPAMHLGSRPGVHPEGRRHLVDGEGQLRLRQPCLRKRASAQRLRDPPPGNHPAFRSPGDGLLQHAQRLRAIGEEMDVVQEPDAGSLKGREDFPEAIRVDGGWHEAQIAAAGEMELQGAQERALAVAGRRGDPHRPLLQPFVNPLNEMRADPEDRGSPARFHPWAPSRVNALSERLPPRLLLRGRDLWVSAVNPSMITVIIQIIPPPQGRRRKRARAFQFPESGAPG
jgi:hypothetical protein